jgi:hypothetical protein
VEDGLEAGACIFHFVEVCPHELSGGYGPDV